MVAAACRLEVGTLTKGESGFDGAKAAASGAMATVRMDTNFIFDQYRSVLLGT